MVIVCVAAIAIQWMVDELEHLKSECMYVVLKTYINVFTNASCLINYMSVALVCWIHWNCIASIHENTITFKFEISVRDNVYCWCCFMLTQLGRHHRVWKHLDTLIMIYRLLWTNINTFCSNCDAKCGNYLRTRWVQFRVWHRHGQLISYDQTQLLGRPGHI